MKFIFFIILQLPLFLTAQALQEDTVISKKGLEETLLFLSNDQLAGRLTGSPGATEAADYIAQQFSSIGLTPLNSTNSYFDSFPINNNKKAIGLNIMGLLPSDSGNDSMVIFSAHYDHVGQGNDLVYNENYRNDDAIYNGANDNATGVAALMELAKYYRSKANNHYNLLFIAFGGEEMGMVGSWAYVEKVNPKLVKAVINLEMLGRPVNGRCFIVSLRSTKVGQTLNKRLAEASGEPGIKFFGKDTYYEENLGERSDHYPFAKKIKNAFTIMGSSPRDEFYHSVDDEYETIDFDFLLKATRNIAVACEVFTE